VGTAIPRSLAFNYGRGSRTSSPHNLGGYLCYDWARSFAMSAQYVKSKYWEVKTGMAGKGSISVKELAHYYVKLTACKNRVEEVLRKTGVEDTACQVVVDDGFVGKSGFVHDGQFPRSAGWLERDKVHDPSKGFTEPPIYYPGGRLYKMDSYAWKKYGRVYGRMWKDEMEKLNKAQ